MVGEKDLHRLLSNMSPQLHDEIFVFATLKDKGQLPQSYKMIFEEDEGMTVILAEEVAKAAGLSYIFRSQMITLNVHSSLEAVGLMSAVSAALTDAGIGTNPVAGYFHDHLFVPIDQAQRALRVLEDLSTQSA